MLEKMQAIHCNYKKMLIVFFGNESSQFPILEINYKKTFKK